VSEREREKKKLKAPHKRKILLLFVRALGFHYAGAKGRRGAHVHTISTPSNGLPLWLRLFDIEKHNGGPGTEVKRKRERETITEGSQTDRHIERHGERKREGET